MSEHTANPAPGETGHICFYAHDTCTSCPPPRAATSHLSKHARAVMDAVGDVRIELLRDHDGLTTWDVGVYVYSVDSDYSADDMRCWTVEHRALAGVPSWMPPNCPEWLWLAYAAISEMCTHFMDMHDLGGAEDAGK